MSGRSNEQAWLKSMNTGTQCFQQRRMDDALNAFSQATRLMPGRAEGWVNLGSALLEQKQTEASVVALAKAIEINPGIAAAQMLLGDALRQLGEYTLALQRYRQAVALQRTPLALNKLACALRVVDQIEESRALYLEALHLDPGFTLAQVNLATLKIEAHEFDAARLQLSELSDHKLSPIERAEVISSQHALDEYFRLNEVIATLCNNNDPVPLQAALSGLPEPASQVDEAALDSIRRCFDSAQQLEDNAAPMVGTPPEEWPLIEAMFMIPLTNSVSEYLEMRDQLKSRQAATGDLLESINMQDAIVAARACRDDISDPLQAELHLRHWHVLACRGIEGFMPGHFKYTQNWTRRSPTLRRVEPALASGTFRHFIGEYYSKLQPGLPRAAVVWMTVCDLHSFADGNGRVAMTWLNRELEWAGLMPALFSRELGLKAELGKVMKEVRTSGGDLKPLLALIRRAQSFAVQFCAALQDRR